MIALLSLTKKECSFCTKVNKKEAKLVLFPYLCSGKERNDERTKNFYIDSVEASAC
jgi:hypothetical protein